MEKQYYVERYFKHFDTNGDGKICGEELLRCLEAIGGGEWRGKMISAAEAEKAVVIMDLDGDGVLGLEDFIKLIDGLGGGNGRGGGGGGDDDDDDLKEAFKMYEDEAKEGCITSRSLRRVLRRMGEERSLEECSTMIARFDLDKNGVVDFHEFRAMMRTVHSSLPTK